MKTLLFSLLLISSAALADVKISQLPLGSAASTNVNDSFPYVSTTAGATQRLKLSDLINLPQVVATYAPIASPTFTGTVTAPTIVLSSGATVGYCWEATSTGGAGAWSACSTFVNPMTTLGDLIYGGASGAATRLAGNTTATKEFLTQTGTGSASAAPAWGTISASDVPTLNQNTTGSAGSLTQSLTSGEPVIGNGTGITVGTKSGNTTEFASVTGSLTSGDCLQADANGNVETTGSACGSAGGGVTTVGTYNSQTSNANGAVISGSDIYFQPFTSSNPGMAPASGGGTTNFLRADGTWAAPGGSGSGTVNSGTAGQMGYYASTGTAISGNANATISSGNLTLGVAGTAAGTITLSGSTSGTFAQNACSNGTDPGITWPCSRATGMLWNNGSGVGSWTASPTLTGLNISGLTASEAVVTDASKNLASLPYSTTPAASTLSEWDANSNLSANNFIAGYTTTATAAGTTTLTVSSAQQQFFTGTTTQTVVMPVTSTLALGQEYTIVNNSTGTLTVESSGANTINTIPGGATGYYTCVLTSGTTAASWSGSVWSNSALNYPTFSVNTSTTAASTSQNFIYSNVVNDSSSGYSGSTGKYTIPVGHGGLWHFTSTIYVNAGMAPAIYVNGAVVEQGSDSTSAQVGIMSADILVSAGDIIDIRPNAGGTFTATGGSSLNQFSGYQIITSQAQPIGNVTSSGSGQYHTEAIPFTCSSASSLGAGSPAGWTIGNIASSGCTVTMNTGDFSAAPYACIGNPTGSTPSSTIFTFNPTSATSVTIYGSGSPASFTGAFLCFGPH